MKIKFAGIALVACLLLAASALPQTKISTTGHCAKPDPQYSIPIGQKPGEALGLMGEKCTYDPPLELAGVPFKDAQTAFTNEMRGNRERTNGYVWSAIGGDSYLIRAQGTGQPDKTSEGKWNFVSGTGKLKGISGAGTWKCKPEGEGSTCAIEGSWELGAAKPAAKK